MARPTKQTGPDANRAVAHVAAEGLKKFRRGQPIGISQAQRMTEAARWGQLGTERAVLLLLGTVMNPAEETSLRVAAANSLLDRFGFPKRNDVSFAGQVVSGSPQDYQAAIEAAVAVFMGNRAKYVVHATDAVEFTEGNGAAHTNGSGAGAIPPDGDPGAGGTNGSGPHGEEDGG